MAVRFSLQFLLYLAQLRELLRGVLELNGVTELLLDGQVKIPLQYLLHLRRLLLDLKDLVNVVHLRQLAFSFDRSHKVGSLLLIFVKAHVNSE